MKSLRKGICITMLACIVGGMIGCSSQGRATAATQIDKTYTKGTVTESTYESEFLDLKFKAPKGGIILKEEQMEELKHQSQQIIGDSTKANKSVYELVTYAEDQSTNVNITTTEVTSNVTTRQFVEQTKESVKAMKNIKYTCGDTKEVDMWGHEYCYAEFSLEYSSVKMQQRCYCRKINNQMVAIILTYKDEDQETGEKLLKGFSQYK